MRPIMSARLLFFLRSTGLLIFGEVLMIKILFRDPRGFIRANQHPG